MRRLVGLTSLVTCLGWVTTVGTTAMAQEPFSSSPNPEFVTAAWVATDGGLLKLAAGDGTVLIEIPDAKDLRVLAIDDRHGILWGYGQNLLRAYAFNGEFLVGIPPPILEDDDDRHIALNANPNNGTVWLAVKTHLFHFDRVGNLLHTIELPDNVQTMIFDRPTDRLWVATKKSTILTAYDDLANVAATIDPGISVEAEVGDLWIGLDELIRLYDRARLSALEIDIEDVEHVAGDGQGGIWVATKKRLIRLEPPGDIAFSMEPFEGRGTIIALVGDPSDRSAWLANQKTLSHIAADRARLHDRTFQPRLRALALYADIIAPVLAVTAPVTGGFLNTNTPGIELNFSDIGSGVNPTTLVITVNDAPSAVSCIHRDDGATCTPGKALPEGAVTLTATASDHAGNASGPSVVVFTVDTAPPAAADIGLIDVGAVIDGHVTITGASASVEPGTILTITNTTTGEIVVVTANADGGFTATMAAQAGDGFSIVSTDAAGNAGSVITVGGALTLAPVGDRAVALGSTLSLTLSAASPGGTPVSFSASPLPLSANATLNGMTGVFTFIPAADQVGDVVLTFIASDGVMTDSETITITVTGPLPGGVTALTGRLLDTNAFAQGTEIPVIGATVSLVDTGLATMSAADGTFTLSGIATPSPVLDIDASTAAPAPDGSPYASFRESIAVIDGVTNVVDRPFFLPRIAAESLTAVDPSTTTTVSNPTLGVTLTIPPNTAMNPDGTVFTGALSISEVPEGLAPTTLPKTIQPGLLVTVQPVGVVFSAPTPITFPNIDGLTPGSEVNLWSLDPETGGFAIVGTGVVRSDGAAVDTVSGGVRAASWHAILPPEPPNDYAGAGSRSGSGAGSDGGGNADGRNGDERNCCAAPSGSRTAVSTGSLMVDHPLAKYRSLGQPRSLQLLYRSHTADPQPVVSFTTTVPKVAAVPPTVSATLTVADIEQTEVFTDTAGLNEGFDEPLHQSLQFDASAFETGGYKCKVAATSVYPLSSVSSIQEGMVFVHNRRDSPVGAGWAINGLQRLHRQPNGTAVITDGGSIFAFRQGLPPIFPVDASTTAMFEFDGDVADAGGHGRDAVFLGGEFVSTLLGQGLRVGALGDGIDWSAFKHLLIHPFTIEMVLTPTITTSGYILKFDDFDGALFYSQEGFASQNAQSILGQGLAQPNEMHYVAITTEGGSVPDYQVTFQGAVLGRTSSGISFPPQPSIPGPFFFHRQLGKADDQQLRATIEALRISSGTRSQEEMTATQARIQDLLDPNTSVAGAPFVSPDGDFSTLVEHADGTFTRTLKDGTQVHFDATGLHTTTVDRNGKTTIYTYDTQDRLIAMTDPTGLVTTFSYTDDHMSSITDPAGRATTVDHDANGNLIRITDPDGSMRQFTYDARHRMTAQIAKNGETTTYTYNAAGQNTGATLPDGTTRRFTPKGSVGLNDPTSGLGTESTPAPVVRPAEAFATRTDGNGNATQYSTNGFGSVIEITDALGRTTSFSRDTNTNPTRITRPNGAVTSMTYDERGNLLTSTDESIGATTAFTYEPTFNQVASITDPKGTTTTIHYDTSGNPIEITDATGARTMLSYTDTNCPGHVTSIIRAAGLAEENATRFAYDPETCNLVQTVDPLGNATLVAYDVAGNVVQVTDAEGRMTRFQYDVMNRLTRVVDATSSAADPPCGSAGVTCYAYDVEGNLTEVTDARGSQTMFRYDARNRRISAIDPLGQIETMAYDGENNLTTRVDRKGQTLDFAYDAVNRLIQKVLQPGAPDEAVTTFGYDVGDNLTSVVDPDSALTLTYDALNRVTSASTAGSPSQPDVQLDYVYDMNGNRVSMTESSHPTSPTTYGYDALNRLTSLANPSGHTASFTHDPLSRRTRTALPNGTTANFSYDTAGQLLTLMHQTEAGAISSFAYSYDPVGNRSTLDQQRSAVSAAPAFSYAYDAVDRLIQATHPLPANPMEIFAYDPVGNRLLKDGQTNPGVFDAANRLLEDEQFCYAYDANGNRSTKESKVAGVCDGTGTLTEYAYDAANQLVEVRVSGAIVATYRYDGLGRRIEKNGSGTLTQYAYDHEDILLEFDGTNHLVARYTHGPGIDEPLVLERDTDGDGVLDASFVYHADGLGSITELTDETGAVVQAYTYTVFGQVASTLDPTFIQPYTFTGREFDPETGLYYYRARYYDPSTGRFLQEDPIGFPGGDVNLYPYVRNNPVKFIDPDGLLLLLAGGGASAIGKAGGEIGGGLAINLNPTNPEIATFLSAGAGTGVNVSADLFVGLFRGDVADLPGVTFNVNVVAQLSILPLSGTLFFDPLSGQLLGGTLGAGPSATRFGLSTTLSLTELLSCIGGSCPSVTNSCGGN